MAAVQHTPSNDSGSKDFLESMEEELRRCNEHLQRRQSKRNLRGINGYSKNSENGEDSNSRKYAMTLPRSFTIPSTPEARDVPFTRHKSPSRNSSRSPRTPSMKAPIGAPLPDSYTKPEHSEVVRGRSAPPDSTVFNYYASSSSSEHGYSSRESSITPQGMSSTRSLSGSPRSSMSPPPVAPKPSGRSRERAWSNKRKQNGNGSPKVIRAVPEDSNASSTIPVSNQPIELPTSPIEFPSAEIESSGFGTFGEISPSKSENADSGEAQCSDGVDIQPVECELIDSHDSVQTEPVKQPETEPVVDNCDSSKQIKEVSNETKKSPKTVEELASQNITSQPENEPNKQEVTHKEEPSSLTLESVPDKAEHAPKGQSPTPKGQSLAELNSPEIKSLPKKIRHRSISREIPSPKEGSPGKRRHSRTHSESKIHITVSSSAKKGELAQLTQEVEKPLLDEKTLALISDLRSKLEEKEQQVSKLTEQRTKELQERDDNIKKLNKDNKKVEREKWELLKRARDAAERALHLRTQLDLKETSARSVQSELDRTKDELFSVKSANTSLRALLAELRAPQPAAAPTVPGIDVGIQVELGGTLKRNKSMELAFTEGGLSQDQQEQAAPPVPERRPEFHTSTTSLSSTNWSRERSNSISDRWEREEGGSLYEVSLPTGVSASQPAASWGDIKRKKKKSGGLLGGRLRRSTGSKRGSMTSVDGLDMSNSSILQGAGVRGTTPITFPYTALPADIKEHWKIMDQAQTIPFSEWTLQHVVAWMDAGLGMGQYLEAVRDKAPGGAQLAALSDSDLEKRLGISHPLHRRKLRLAIEEQKDPSSSQYPQAGKIDHTWVAYEWAHDCGLAHMTEVLVGNLVDGRLLNTLTKEDLKKHLKLSKKTDQLSFLSAVELLRMHDFNRQVIQDHRSSANNPLYWTNRDVCNWLKSIQLEEYATNVIGGGVHGALLFLERGNFTSDHLASIIQIPSSKGQLRRHLAGKMARLFTEDVSQSMESIPSHMTLLSNSPAISPHGSQSPERRHPSPRHMTGTPPLADSHPSQRNSLTRKSQPLLLEALTRPVAQGPKGFGRTSSGPTPRQQRLSQAAAAERVRHSLRESALRSVSSIHEETTPPVLPPRSFTPTILSSTGTTV